ncbi:MAG: DUF3592 domain-containing protein [Lachnospiraceae bacterium]|nr:DUF3592 domain-containing protein [Lachnospiraceae bacterium]
MLFSNSTKKLGAIILGLGILMLVFNLVMVLWSAIFIATSEVTTGYVKDVQVWETHNNTSSRNRSVHHDTFMTIEYTVDDVVYEKSFKVGNSSANEGRPITVYYKKSNPEKASTGKEAITVDGFVIFLTIFFGGLIYLKGTEQD